MLVVEPTTFPTDGYITAGVADLMGLELRWCDPADPLAAVDDDVALLSLTHVDFRTGAMFDMAGDHRRGAGARRAGAVGPVPLGGRGAGRPDRRRAPTWRSAAPTSTSTAVPAPPPSSGSRRGTRPRRASRSPAGWATRTRSRWRATTSRPRASAAFASGTPPVLALSALEAALEAFDGRQRGRRCGPGRWS